MLDDNNLLMIFTKYNLNEFEEKELFDIISPIYYHTEFLKRMTDKFPHHGDVTLGIHIIEDATKTYILSKKYINSSKNNNYRLDIAVKIAMLHDLYTVPWQNNVDSRTKHFFNSHGFRHPVEAVINAINWYPNLFEDKTEAEMIIDGIIHHMFPLPVSSSNNLDDNTLELKNFELVNNLSSFHKEMIIKSLSRKRILHISISKSIYKEGRIMATADKYVSIKQIKNISSAKALLTGKNNSIIKK